MSNTQSNLMQAGGAREYTIEAQIPAGGRCYAFFKRLMDILFALFALLVFLVPMLLIALAIAIDSRGGVFFRQERLGKDAKVFAIIKFRTMRTDAEKDGPQWAGEHDDRCTRVGRFLRKCRLDELPQFLNILSGTMSLVGPRPERAYFYDQFETYIHGFKNRLAVTPGLTGLAQVNGGYDLLPEEKIVYDMQYIKERSMMLDIKLLIQTVKLVFTHEGAR